MRLTMRPRIRLAASDDHSSAGAEFLKAVERRLIDERSDSKLGCEELDLGHPATAVVLLSELVGDNEVKVDGGK
jgi:hypothetical protein